MVEEAVEEVLDLVKKAAQQVKPTEINPDFEFLIADGIFLFFDFHLLCRSICFASIDKTLIKKDS